jgi:IclR family acetate operon transcriptional repressor
MTAVADSQPVKSASRVLDIVELLAAEPEGLSATEISEKLGIARSSTHALIRTLAARGYLRPDASNAKRFALGATFIQLGLSVSDRLELRTVARGVLERLVSSWHETAVLAVIDNDNLAYIDKIVSDEFGFRTDPRVNLRRPLHSHSLGKAVLAAADNGMCERLLDGRLLEPVTEYTIVDAVSLREELRRTRERGYSTDQQEAVLGVCCVGAPIRDHTERVIGAICLSTIREYYQPTSTGPAVRDAAFEISRSMGWSGKVEAIYGARRDATETSPVPQPRGQAIGVRT